MNIKVSGITSLKQLKQLDGLDIDYAGIAFDTGSPWFLGDRITKKELKNADFDIKKIGIFTNPEMIDVLDAIDDYGLDVVQLNGSEIPEMCGDLSSEVEVIKTFQVAASTEFEIDKLVAPYDEVCDFYLFEAADGADQRFDWSILNRNRIEKPFFLSGGIGPDDAGAVKAFRHSDFFGIDINQQFEKSTGEKDMALLLKFLQALKKK